jgi:hypothetical protein
MGRPPKKRSEVKASTLTVRLTTAERLALDKAAKADATVPSEWARIALRAALLARSANI